MSTTSVIIYLGRALCVGLDAVCVCEALKDISRSRIKLLRQLQRPPVAYFGRLLLRAPHGFSVSVQE